jgi:hypothetical protein
MFFKDCAGGVGVHIFLHGLIVVPYGDDYYGSRQNSDGKATVV